MSIHQWAHKWGIPPEAVMDLTVMLTHYGEQGDSSGTETDNVKAIRLEAARNNRILWRNNTGVAFSKSGRPVRYGLANDSHRVNEVCKSSDLIGITPVTITSEHVGSTIGQFTAREVKKSKWIFSGTPEEMAQAGFLWIVNNYGGDGCFTNGTGSL